MKKATITLFALLITFGSFAQESKTKIYGSASLEMIFSWAFIDNQGNEEGIITRWAPVFNVQSMANFDFNKHIGLFTGLAVRNVGFIYENPFDSNNTKYKFRTYNLGIPVGIKLGNFERFTLFGGYEIEFPFVYKEKHFVNEEKVYKEVLWFSDRVEPIQHSVLAGIQFPYGAYLKFKYYLSNFHDRDYIYKVDGQDTKPYDFASNVFYFSIGWNIFTDWDEYNPKQKEKEIR
jgi:hypothetical protein